MVLEKFICESGGKKGKKSMKSEKESLSLRSQRMKLRLQGLLKP